MIGLPAAALSGAFGRASPASFADRPSTIQLPASAPWRYTIVPEPGGLSNRLQSVPRRAFFQFAGAQEF
jgi:hypothetical protein